MPCPNLELQGVHGSGRRTAYVPAVGVEDSSVTGAVELSLVGMPVDRAPQVRTDRRQDPNRLVAFALTVDPDRVSDAGLFPAVLVEHLQGEQAPLPRREARQGSQVYKGRLVGFRRDGKHNYYHLASAHVRDLFEQFFADAGNGHKALHFEDFALTFKRR